MSQDRFRGLLEVPDSELAGTLRDGLKLLARALEQTAFLNPDDPGAEAFAAVRAALQDLLGEEPTSTSEPALAHDAVSVLFDRFYEDRAVQEHLGDARRRDDTPARQWLAFNCALLRLPRKLAETWRVQAAQAARVPASPDGLITLPALDSGEDLILPWPDQDVRGVRTVVGAPAIPEVARALGIDDDPTAKALAALASQVLTIAALDPEALYFESLIPQPRSLSDPSARADYARELATRLASYPAAARTDRARALDALVALDEALCSVAHLPPAADPASWWNQTAARSHELVFTLAGALPGQARVREPARRFRDVRDLTEDDVPVVSRTHPGRVIWCLRLYAEIDGTARRGRVIYGVDR